MALKAFLLLLPTFKRVAGRTVRAARNSTRLRDVGIQTTARYSLRENDMGLNIKRLTSGLYEASATPPHVKAAWTSSQPLPARELIKKLQARGCHPRDVGDAMYEQDPSWVEKL